MVTRRSLLLLLACVAPVAMADKGGHPHHEDDDDDDRGHGRGHDPGERDHREDHGHHAVREYRFAPDERRRIVEYYGRPDLPPGLAKRGGDLPPGLARQLQRNGRLPPGLEKRMAPMPVALERQLPPPPPGCYRRVIGDQAIIYNPRTLVVVDFFNIHAAVAIH